MTKIDIFSGFLGAGKTTLIKKLIAEAYTGEQLVLIENEFGEIGIDGGFLQEAGINITEMNSGCICCSLVGDFGKALRQVMDTYHPDRILIEPSGVGKLSDVIRAVQNLEMHDVVLNGFTTVVDATKAKMYMRNFGEFFNNQVEHASAIILSRTAGMSQEKLDACVALLREKNPTATIVTTPWDELDGKQLLAQINETYQFDRIVYFSEYLTPHSEQEGELDRLRRVLQANRERPSQLLYLAGPEAVLTPFIGKSVLAQAAEYGHSPEREAAYLTAHGLCHLMGFRQALCRHYAETSRVQIKVLHLPYLYGTDCTGAPVGIAQLLTRPKSGELHFEEQALAPVAALCMEDLSELVLRVFDNWTPEWESLTAPVVFHWNYEQLGEAWKALCPGLTVTYGSDLIREYPPDDGQLRRAYGWFPRYDLLDDLPRFFRQEKQPQKMAGTAQRLCRAAPAAGPGAGTAGGLGRIRTAGADDKHPGAVPGGGFPAGVHRAHRRCLRPERRRGGGVSGVALAGGGLLGRGRVAAAALLRAVQLAGLPRVFRGGGG